MFAFEMNEYKVDDISFLTHPELPLLKAIQMSCALPILVTPVIMDDKCYMDGGIGCNYPLNFCIDAGKNPDEILGFRNKYSDDKSYINNNSNLMDYVLNFLFKAINNLDNNNQPSIKNEVEFDTKHLTIEILKNALFNIDVRRELFEKGKHATHTFLNLLDK